MELLNKPVLTINNIKDNISFNMEIDNYIPKSVLNIEINDKLNKYKSMIDNTNIKIWDFCKKISNEYELLHHCIRNKKY